MILKDLFMTLKDYAITLKPKLLQTLRFCRNEPSLLYRMFENVDLIHVIRWSMKHLMLHAMVSATFSNKLKTPTFVEEFHAALRITYGANGEFTSFTDKFTDKFTGN